MLVAAYDRERVPLFRLGCAYAAGVAANAFLPARGGEGVKVALARAQIPTSSMATIGASLSVVLALDAALGAGLIVGLWTTGVVPSLPALPDVGLLPVMGALLPASAVVGGLALPRSRRWLRRLLSSAARGVVILRRPGRYVAGVLPFQLAAWTSRIGVAYVLLHAFRIEAGIETALLLVVLNGAATAVPIPGGAGSQQLVAAFALQGVMSTAGAVSFSLGMQLAVTGVNTAVGLAAIMLLYRTAHPLAALRAVRAAPAGDTAEP